MKITEKQLRKVIREYYEKMLSKGHVDGHPWSGSLEDLATVQSKTWGNGAVVDSKGWSKSVDLARHWTRGTARSANAKKLAESEMLKEYEQYVDEDGNIYDDEGNVTKMGRDFGRQYGGGTYGTNAPWHGRRSRYSSRRKTTNVGTSANAEKIAAVEAALEAKPNNFLTSILKQLKAGRGLSSKQNKIVSRILSKSSKEAAALFEFREKIKRIVKEETGKMVDILDDVSDAEINAAWPDRVTFNGHKVFDMIYGNSALMSSIYSVLKNSGFSDPNEVFLGYDFDSGDFIMGFDAFEEFENDWGDIEYADGMDGVFVNIRAYEDGTTGVGRVVAQEPDGVYSSGGVNPYLMEKFPDLMPIRLD